MEGQNGINACASDLMTHGIVHVNLLDRIKLSMCTATNKVT